MEHEKYSQEDLNFVAPETDEKRMIASVAF